VRAIVCDWTVVEVVSFFAEFDADLTCGPEFGKIQNLDVVIV